MTCIPLWKEVACLVARIGVPELKSHDGHQRSVELCCAWGSHKLLYDTELQRQEQAFLNACPSRVKLTNIHRRDPPTQEALKRAAVECDNWGKDPPSYRSITSFAAACSSLQYKADEPLLTLAGVIVQSALCRHTSFREHQPRLSHLNVFPSRLQHHAITLTSDPPLQCTSPSLQLRLSLLLTVHLTMLQARFCRALSHPMRMDASSTP